MVNLSMCAVLKKNTAKVYASPDIEIAFTFFNCAFHNFYFYSIEYQRVMKTKCE